MFDTVCMCGWVGVCVYGGIYAATSSCSCAPLMKKKEIIIKLIKRILSFCIDLIYFISFFFISRVENKMYKYPKPVIKVRKERSWGSIKCVTISNSKLQDVQFMNNTYNYMVYVYNSIQYSSCFAPHFIFNFKSSVRAKAACV